MYRTFPWSRSLHGYHWNPDPSPGTAAGDSGGGSTTGTPSGGSPPPSSTTPPPSGGQPASTAAGAGGDQPSPGPVDYNRFKEVNDRAQKTSWAEQYDPDEVTQATQLYRWFDRDPQGAYEYLTGIMKRSGVIKDAPVSPPSGRSDSLTEPQTGRPLPDILIQETGQRLYSAEQAQRLMEWTEQRIDSRLKPLEERTAATQAETQARNDARSQIQDAEKNWPSFNDFAEDIFTELQKDRRLSLEGAYRRVVVPKIRQQERAAVIQEMRGKGNAGTGNPAGTSPASTVETQKLPLRELFRREMVKRGIGT